MKCLLDLDGVLADFVTAACKAHGRDNVYCSAESRGNYSMEVLMGISGNEFWEPFDENFWADIPLMPDAAEILKATEATFGRENICLLTTPSLNPGCAAGKVRWIEKHLPEYRRRFLIGPRKEFCAHSRSVLIDDYDYNVQNFRTHGGHAVLVPRPWNSLHHASESPIDYIKRNLDENCYHD